MRVVCWCLVSQVVLCRRGTAAACVSNGRPMGISQQSPESPYTMEVIMHGPVWAVQGLDLHIRHADTVRPALLQTGSYTHNACERTKSPVKASRSESLEQQLACHSELQPQSCSFGQLAAIIFSSRMITRRALISHDQCFRSGRG